MTIFKLNNGQSPPLPTTGSLPLQHDEWCALLIFMIFSCFSVQHSINYDWLGVYSITEIVFVIWESDLAAIAWPPICILITMQQRLIKLMVGASS